MEKVTIAGREFKEVRHSTARHDILTQGQIIAAGLHSLTIEPGEQHDEFMMRVLRTAALKSDIFLLLGHLIMPANQQGKEWTPEMAKETAEFLGNVTDQRDKQIVQAQITSALMSFFLNGISFLSHSPNSSSGNPEPTTPIEEAKITGIGESSSGSSRVTITSERKKFSIGRCVSVLFRFCTSFRAKR